jgi:hypothetical protein
MTNTLTHVPEIPYKIYEMARRSRRWGRSEAEPFNSAGFAGQKSQCSLSKNWPSRRGEAVETFDDLQIDLYLRWMDTDNLNYLTAFVATCSPDQLRELHMRVEKINKDAARRAAFRLIKGGKDEPKPATLKGEFNL